MKRKGKWIAALIAVCLSFTFLAACGGGKYAIELNRNSASVYVGEELTLTAKVTLGGEETAAAVSWTSSDPSVATVENGKVKALKAGKTTVAATAEKVSAACEVTVLEPSFTISLDKSELPLFVGESETLNVTASDGNTYDYGWSSSNKAVATVEGTTNVYPQNLEETLYLFGEKGTVKIGGTSTNNLDVWQFADETEADEANRGLKEQTSNVYGNGHTSLYADVIDAIQNHRKPYVDAVAGRNALELVLAIYKSCKTGQPVKLPLKEFASEDMKGLFGNGSLHS